MQQKGSGGRWSAYGNLTQKLVSLFAAGGGLQHLAALTKLLIVLSLAGLASVAFATTYVYDANGRLQAATNSSGATANYIYDSRGNLVRIVRTGATQLAVTGFLPAGGVPGSQVTVSGTGFSSTAASNTVKFNGTAAAVLSATSTQLVAQVPQTATSGPISVTVGTTTATSAGAFSVTQVGFPPAITSVSPSIAAMGTTVTVQGQHFYPIAGETAVFIDGEPVLPASITDQQISIVVPPYGTSGAITVTTPYGSASSSGTLYVIPTGMSPSNVVQTGSIQVGSTATAINISSINQMAVLTFSANAGDYYSIQGSTFSGGTVSYNVTSPFGGVVANGLMSSTAPTIHLPALTMTGVYTVSFSGYTSGAQFSVALEKNIGISIDGSTTSFSTSGAYQSKQLYFVGQAGQTVTLSFTNVVVSPATPANVNVYVVDRTGVIITSNSVATPSGFLRVGPLPITANYAVQIGPSAGQTESFSVTAVNDATGVLTINGAPSSLSTTVPGQAINLSFNGTAGQNLALSIPGFSVTSPYSYVNVAVSKPDGSTLVSQSVTPATDIITLNNLPVTGTYNVQLLRTDSVTMSATVQLSQDQAIALASNGAASNLATAYSGQAAQFSVSATAGQSLGVWIQGLTFTPAAITYANITVFQPNGSVLQNQTCSQSASHPCDIELAQVPATGTYIVQMVPAGPATMSATVTEAPELTAALPSNGSSVAVSATIPGQNATLTYSATAGQNLVLWIQGLTVTPSTSYPTLTVSKPDGTLLTSASCSTSMCSVHLENLPTSGIYRVRMKVTDLEKMAFSAAAVSDTTAALPATGTSSTYSTSTPGQGIDLTFSGTAGQYLSFNVGNLSFGAGGITSATVYIYAPDGTLLSTTTCNASSGGCAIALNNLPATGTYRIKIVPGGMATMSASAGVVADVSTTISTAGAMANVSTSVPGQAISGTFSGTAGQALTLGIGNLSITPASVTSALVSIYSPSGGFYGSITCLVSDRGCSYSMASLAYTGTYRVVVLPNGPGTMSLSIGAGPTATASLTAGGSATNVSTTVPGQPMTLSFAANAGQNLSLGIGAITSSAGASAFLSATVYQPNGSYLTSASCMAPAGCALLLSNLAATGTYQVQISAGGLATVSLTATLSAAATGTISSGTPAMFSTSRAGQSVLLSFSGTAGQNLALALSSISASPSSGYLNAVVYQPNGAQLTSTFCFPPSGCSFNLQNLPATGTYQVLVAPSVAATVTFTATLSIDVTAAISGIGSTTNVSTSIGGQVAIVTFSGTAGQSIGLAIGNISVSPSSGVDTLAVTVYAPSGATFSSTSCSTANGGCVLNLNALPSTGTYKVIVVPAGAVTMSFSAVVLSDLTATIATTGAVSNFSTASAGQVVSLSFNTTAGQTLGISLGSVLLNPANEFYGLTIIVYNSSGTVVAGAPCLPAIQTCNVGLTVPATGTYTVQVVPGGLLKMSFGIAISVDQSGTVATNGTSTNASTSASGQSVDLSFSASAGQNLSVGIEGLSFSSPLVNSAAVVITSPTGGQIASVMCYSSVGGCTVPLTNLPATGSYQVRVSPGGTATMSFQMIITADTTGTLVVGGSVQSISLSSQGQAGLLSFNGTAGQNVGLVASTSSVGMFQLSILNPDGTALATTYGYGNSFIGPYALQQSGTYSVVVSAYGGATGSVALQIFTVPSATTSSVVVNGLPGAAAITVAGQAANVTFAGTAGQTVALRTSSGSLTNNAYYVSILNPDGSQLMAPILTADDGFFGNILTPTTGTYTIVLNGVGGSTGTLMAQVFQVTASPTTTLSGTTPASLTMTSSGQGAWFGFTATAGQQVSFAFSGDTFNNVHGDFNVWLFDSNFNVIAGPVDEFNGAVLGPFTLSTAGSYAILVQPQAGATGAITVQMVSAPANTSGTIAIDGTSKVMTQLAGSAGASLTFVGTAGQKIVPFINNSALGSDYTLVINNPDGSQLVSSASGLTFFAPVALPQTGTYTVKLTSAHTNGSLELKLLSIPPDVYNFISPIVPATVTTGAIDQAAVLAMVGITGQKVTLTVSRADFATSFFDYYLVSVLNPDGSVLLNQAQGFGYPATFGPLTLPQNGLYSIRITPMLGVGTLSVSMTTS